MRKTTAPVMFTCSLLATGWLLSEEAKPNFSGVWKLNKEKSELTLPTMRQPGGGGFGGGPSTGGPGGGPGGGGGDADGGMGGPGMGGAGGMGGPGMGGGGMGGSGMGGPGMGRPGRGGPGGTAGRDPRMVGVAETVEIAHEEPKLVIKATADSGNKGQVIQSNLTTDGKTNETPLPGGGTLKSKSTWKKGRLTTKSAIQSPTGSVDFTEVRRLSEDGRTMTVALTMSSLSMYWKRTLVYEEADAPPPVH